MCWRHPNMNFTMSSSKKCRPTWLIKGGWSRELKWYSKLCNCRVHQMWRNEGVEVFKNHKGWGSEIWNWVLFIIFLKAFKITHHIIYFTLPIRPPHALPCREVESGRWWKQHQFSRSPSTGLWDCHMTPLDRGLGGWVAACSADSATIVLCCWALLCWAARLVWIGPERAFLEVPVVHTLSQSLF